MQMRVLGWSELRLSAIGCGTWAMGGSGWKFSWGAQDDAESVRAIQAAFDAGVNWIDTAAIYGHGHAEEVVGRAIKGRRDEIIVATKCGRVWDGESREIGKRLTRQSVTAEAERSLTRLGVDVIDLYQIHWPEPDEEIEEGWGALADLVKVGKVRYVGVSNFSVPQLDRIQPIHPVTSIQPPYSMLRREIEGDIVPWAERHQAGILAYSPMQAGLLTGRFTKARVASLDPDDWRGKHPFFQEPRLSDILGRVDRLRPIAGRLGVTLSQLSLAWVLRIPTVTSAIVGTRSPEQIRETAAAGDIVLAADVVAEIETVLS